MKLTSEKVDVITTVVRQGGFLYEAAVAAGVSVESVIHWRNEGEETGEGIKFQLFQALKRAERDSEDALLDLIYTHSQKSWQAAAWLLERRWPEKYGKQRLEVSAKVQDTDNPDYEAIQKLSTDELDELLKRLTGGREEEQQYGWKKAKQLSG